MHPLGCRRQVDALLDRRRWALPLFAAVALAFTGALYLRPMHLGFGDWLWFHFAWDTARKSLIEHGELLWWNAYACGGTLGVANPQSLSLSPLFWLLLPLPTALAMKAYLTLMTFAGLWGTWELLRRHHGRGLGAAAGAVLFACSGTLGWHMNGQLSMAAFQLLPWAVLACREGARRPEVAPLGGAVLALMLLSAGVYPLAIGAVALALDALARAAAARTLRGAWGALRGLLIAGAAAPLFAAAKLLPLLDFLSDHGRPIAVDDRIEPSLLLPMLLARRTTETQIWPSGSYLYGWWGEYSNYLGALGLSLAVLGVAWGAVRRRPELVCLLIALGLVMGDHGPWSPYGLARKLPVLGSLRVPTRYWAAADLWLACLVAGALTWLGRRAPGLGGLRAWGALGALYGAALWLAVDLVRSNGIGLFSGAMVTAPATPHRAGAAFHQVQGSLSMFLYPPFNLGTLTCFDELTVEVSPALAAELPSEVYLAEPDAGSVRVLDWSPSSWRLDVETTREALVVLNQNYFRGWRAEGGDIEPWRGLVAVRVPEGRRSVVLRYRPPFYRVGVALTLAAVGAGAWWLRRGRIVQGLTGTRAGAPSTR